MVSDFLFLPRKFILFQRIGASNFLPESRKQATQTVTGGGKFQNTLNVIGNGSKFQQLLGLPADLAVLT